MTYYKIVDNGVASYSQDQVVDGSLLGELDRLLGLGAVVAVEDADVPDDAIHATEPAAETDGEAAAPAEEAAAEGTSEVPAAEEPAAEGEPASAESI